MLKKTIKYTDFDGAEQSEDFYFNLSKAEIAEMELSHDGGFSGYLQEIVKAEDGKKIIETFKSILMKAYGERSEDGKRFVKSDEISNAFLQTDAYSELFMELITDPDAAAKFIQAIVPADLSKDMPTEGPASNDELKRLESRLAELKGEAN